MTQASAFHCDWCMRRVVGLAGHTPTEYHVAVRDAEKVLVDEWAICQECWGLVTRLMSKRKGEAERAMMTRAV